MRFCNSLFVALVAGSSLTSTVAAFSSSSQLTRAAAGASSSTLLHLGSSPFENDSAKILSNYLVKAHEEKLKAIKMMENQKSDEIQQLRAKVAALEHELQSSSRASMAAQSNLWSLTREQLIDLVHSYQQFLATYVVKASEAKFRAVEETRRAVVAKFTAAAVKSDPEMTTTTTSTFVSPASASDSSSSSTLYESRNQAVKASASANKSRWGQAEVERLSSVAAPEAVTAKESLVSSSASLPEYQSRNKNVLAAWLEGKSRWMDEEIQRLQGKKMVAPSRPANLLQAVAPMEQSNNEVSSAIDAADHGLRAGLSLGERVTNGASALAQGLVHNVQSYYAARNRNVLDAATKDKTRWGEEEVSRIQTNQASVPAYKKVSGRMLAATPPLSLTQAQVDFAVDAADHGLRADGGVGGLSLGERVNLGAAAVAAASVAPIKAGYANIGASIVSGTTDTAVASETAAAAAAAEASPYQQRNENVIMAAINGLTRWGSDEIARIQSTSTEASAVSSDDLAKIQAADHGLRADGGVGGMTLMERITQGLNVGQAAVANAAEVSPSPISEVKILYDERNRNVLKQGSQSRWGSHEIQRIRFSNSTGTPV
ncbi:hypothetical protein MPSEU_000861100 [Mayamaea pseudoterrestris]|nr:hypothetical protein MPSEU_000861100 [Mayamaea pseudoterrestris]